jgi:hypothetical protein
MEGPKKVGGGQARKLSQIVWFGMEGKWRQSARNLSKSFRNGPGLSNTASQDRPASIQEASLGYLI